MAVMRGAEGVVKTLERYETELVVGYIGHSTHELADAIKHESGLEAVCPVTELAGSHIVNAYNFLRGKPAAVGLWHTCGTLLITGGVYEGLVSRIPSVHIGLNVDGSFKDREAIQEMPNEEVFRALTRRTLRAERPDKLPEAIHRAFQAATGSPAGPTFVDIPFDITIDEAEMTIPTGWQAPTGRSAADPEAVARAAELLVNAQSPVMLIGGGAALSGADEEVRELAELLGIPVTTTYTAQGILSEEHPLALGTSGTLGWSCANAATENADVVLAVGTRIADWGYAQAYAGKIPGQLIHIDTDSAQVGGFYIPEVGMVADAKTALAQLIAAVEAADGFEADSYENRPTFGPARDAKERWIAEMRTRAESDEFPLSPWRVMRDVQAQLGEDDIIVTDTGNNTGWVFQGTIARKKHRLLLSFGAGVLGAGFPMGIGAKLAEPESNVVVALGDGGFQYATNEIATAMRHELAIVVVVFDDGYYGANNGFMNYLYDRTSWVELNNPDYVALAKAYGAQGERIESADQIGDAVKRGIESGTVYVIDAPINAAHEYPATGVGPTIRWEPRQWPADVVGTQAPTKFSAQAPATA
ncbi:MAG: thiamine pyrophosphate-binding protein [Solirubrobacterales bacterium]